VPYLRFRISSPKEPVQVFGFIFHELLTAKCITSPDKRAQCTSWLFNFHSKQSSKQPLYWAFKASISQYHTWKQMTERQKLITRFLTFCLLFSIMI